MTEAIKSDAQSSGTGRMYKDNYLNFGFTYCKSETHTYYLFFSGLISGVKLTNTCMVPSKLKIYLTVMCLQI